MRVYSYSIYRTNLYPSYENVVLPTNDTNGNIHLFKKSYPKLIDALYYSSYTINELLSGNTGIGRSLQFTDQLTATIVLPYKAERFISIGYNYILINHTRPYPDDDYLAFFITGVSSLNDSDTSPSCMLSLKYDSWGNHWNQLALAGNKGYLATGHFKNTYVSNNIFNMYNISSMNGDSQTYKEYSIIENKDGFKRVIFIELTLKEIPPQITSNNIKFRGTLTLVGGSITTDFSFTKWDTPLYEKYGRYIIYIPCFISTSNSGLNSFNETITKVRNKNTFTFNFLNQPDTDYLYLNETDYIVNGINNIPDSLKSYVISARYTSHTPIPYTLLEDNSVNIEGLPVVYYDNIPTVGIYPLQLTYLQGNDNTITLNISTDKHSSYINVLQTFEAISENSVDFEINKSGNLNKELSITAHTAPVYEKLLIINGKEFKFPNDKFLSNIFTLSIYKDTAQPFIRIKNYSNKVISNLLGTYLETTPCLSYSINSLDDYLIRNGSQKDISLQIAELNKVSTIRNGIYGAINNVSGVFTGGITAGDRGNISHLYSNALKKKQSPASRLNLKTGIINQSIGITGAVGGAISSGVNAIQGIGDTIINAELAQKSIDMINGKLTDINNSPDDFKGSYGEDDKKIMDLIFTVTKRYNGNEIDLEKMYYNEYRLGVLPNSVVPILERYKTSFDYKKFTDVDLTTLRLPLQIINDLEEMLINGFTVHYCDGNHSGVKPYNLTSPTAIQNGFNIDTIVNVDKEFRFDKNYIDWLGRKV